MSSPTSPLIRTVASAAQTLLAGFTLTAGIQSASASVVVSIEPLGQNVSLTVVGSLNTTTLTADGTNSTFVAGQITGSTSGGTIASGTWISSAPDYLSAVPYSVGNFTSFPSSLPVIASSNSYFSDTGSGKGFALTATTSGSIFYVSKDYVSGTAFNSTSTWENKTISGLGLNPGSYVWNLKNSETITVNIIPEPSSLMLLGAGFTLALGRRRRSQL